MCMMYVNKLYFVLTQKLCFQVMRYMTSEECAELERLLTEESSASKDGASINMGRSPTKARN